jgi:hypothetical protein
MAAGTAQRQRVAIGRRLGTGIAADGAASTGLVFHHHGLAQLLGQGFGHHPRDDIVGPARWKGHDELDGPFRPCRPGGGLQKAGGEHNDQVA